MPVSFFLINKSNLWVFYYNVFNFLIYINKTEEHNKPICTHIQLQRFQFMAILFSSVLPYHPNFATNYFGESPRHYIVSLFMKIILYIVKYTVHISPVINCNRFTPSLPPSLSPFTPLTIFCC